MKTVTLCLAAAAAAVWNQNNFLQAVVAAPTSTTCPKTNIKLKAVGGPYDGQYATISHPFQYVIDFTPTITDAALFDIDSSSHLNQAGTDIYGAVTTYDTEPTVFFNTAATIFQYGNADYISCTLAEDNAVNCQTPSGLSVSQTCGNIYGSGAGYVLSDKLITDRGEDTTPCYLFSFVAVC